MKKPFITYLGVMIHPSNLNMTPDFKLSHILKKYLLNQNCYDKHKSQIRQEVKFQHTQITLFVETFVIVVLTQVYIFQVCTQHLALCISLQILDSIEKYQYVKKVRIIIVMVVPVRVLLYASMYMGQPIQDFFQTFSIKVA